MEDAKYGERDTSPELPYLAPRRPSIAQVLGKLTSRDSDVSSVDDHEASAETSTLVPKTYFLVPSFDFPPDGPIRPGTIITKPDKPEQSLTSGHITEIPHHSISSSHKSNWQQTIESGKTGIWERFVNSVTLRQKLSTGLSDKETIRYSAKELETVTFNPTQTYIEEAMSHDSIRQYLENSRYKVPLYMITGVKIVRGGKVESERTSSVGLPVDISPELGLEGINVGMSRSEGTSFVGMSDFVLAYRLTKITSSQKTRVKLGAIFRGRSKESSRFITEDINGDEYGIGALFEMARLP